MKKDFTIILILAATAMAANGCVERHPEVFGDISAIYFNNRAQGNTLCDSTDVTFIYESEDRMEVPVTVQLLGRTADYDRPVEISVSSLNAEEGTDFILPDKEGTVLPAGETSFSYVVTLLRTDALQHEKKEIRLELHPNEHFTLSVTEIGQTTDTVSTLLYRILFSDMFTEAPAAWDSSILGAFSQAKFELICDVLDIDPADFNDAAVMTLPRQMFIYNEISDYIETETEKMENGEPYDSQIIDPATGKPIAFPN